MPSRTHISSCQLCLRMGTIETCFGKILTARRAPLTRYTSPIPPAPTAPEVISGNLLLSLLPTITSGLPTNRPESWSSLPTRVRLKGLDSSSQRGRSYLAKELCLQEQQYSLSPKMTFAQSIFL